MSFIAELKRRNVFRVGIAYVVGGWLLLQLTDVLSELLKLPDVVGRVIVLVVAIGLPVALFFAWAFEMTPEGVKLEKEVDRSQSIAPQTGKKLNTTIMVLLVLTVSALLFDKFSGGTASETTTAVEKASPTTQNISSDADSSTRNKDTTKSIAVLPFTNRSPNADDVYFTDGVHDDLLTQLAKIDAFSVISRTSVMEYRETTKNLKQIGEELGVGNIMEGAVQRSGNRVRINVQLIDAGSDEHLWAEVYDRELTTENLFDIQSEIARAIATALKATLTDSEIAQVSDVPTNNVTAYELYLQGKRFALGETDIGFDTAIELYREALKLDPGFKLAWIGLAQAYINSFWNYGGDIADRENARKSIDMAKAIDSDFGELYMAEGFYHYWGLLDYDTALLNLDKAIALMPGSAEAHMWKGWASRRAGLWEQALESMQTAIRLNPRVVINLIETGQTLSYLGRYDEAMTLTEKAYEVDPDSFWSKSYLAAMSMLVNGDTQRARTLLVGAQHTKDYNFLYSYWETQMLAGDFVKALEFAQSWPDEVEVNLSFFDLREILTAETLLAMGRVNDAKAKALEGLARLEKMKQEGRDDYRVSEQEAVAYSILGDRLKVSEAIAKVVATRPPDAVEELRLKYWFAQGYARAGMSDECISTLDSLLSGPSTISVPWLELDPAFNGIRDNPEFVAMLERHK
jgi:TolB-like protein